MSDCNAIDRWALRDLVEAYAFAADERDGEAFAGVFTPDGALLTGGRTLTGHDEISAVPALLAERFARTLHVVGNHRAVVGGDEATGLTYCLAHHLAQDGDADCETLMVIRYHDRYERTPDGWRIARRQVEIDWQERRPLDL